MVQVVSIDKALSYDGSGASKQVAIPNAIIVKIIDYVNYTVTDASISAGETYDGVTSKVLIGNDKDIHFECERDEMALFGDFLNTGISTGLYSDPLPTTATAQVAHFTFSGPFDLRKTDKPFFRFVQRPVTDEWGSATALTASHTLELYVAEADDNLHSGIRVRRFSGGSTTEHQIGVPLDLHIVALGIVTGSGGLLTKYQIGTELVVPNAYSSHATYSALKTTAPQSSPTRYINAPLHLKAKSGREFKASLSSASTLTLLLFAKT